MELALPPVPMPMDERGSEGDSEGDSGRGGESESESDRESVERARILALIPGLVLPTPSPTISTSTTLTASTTPSPGLSAASPGALSEGITVVLSLSPETRRVEESRLQGEQELGLTSGQGLVPEPVPGLGLAPGPGLEQGSERGLSAEGYGQWLVDERQRLLLQGTSDDDDADTDDDDDDDDNDDDEVDDDDDDDDDDNIAATADGSDSAIDSDTSVSGDSSVSDEDSDGISGIIVVDSPLDPPTPMAMYQQALQRRGLVVEALVEGALRGDVNLAMQVTPLAARLIYTLIMSLIC